MVFSINRWCLLRIQPENQFSETNGKNQEWTSTRVTIEHNSSNSEITSTTVKRSRLHFDLQTQKLSQGSHCGPHLRPAATWKVPELLEVLDLQHPASLNQTWSMVCVAYLPPTKLCPIRSSGWCDPDQDSEMVPQWRGWWMHIHGFCLEILSGRSVQRRGALTAPVAEGWENKGASKLVISTARTVEFHHVKVF